MAIEIDLLNSSGNPAHPPIIDVVSILATERLARAGSFSAEISPASRRDNCKSELVRCWRRNACCSA